MGRPDALSRWADHPRGADDNADFTLLTLEVFELRAMEAITLEGEEAIFMEQIRQSTQFDDPVVKALKALDAGELHSDEWTHTEGVVVRVRPCISNSALFRHISDASPKLFCIL